MGMKRFNAPSLPTPGKTYNPLQMVQLIRALEIYFSQLDSATPIKAEHFEGSASQLNAAHAQFYSTQDQTLGTVDTATPVTFNANYIAHKFSIESNSQVTAAEAGIYGLHFSANLESTGAGGKDVHFWLAKNGTAVDYVVQKYQLASTSDAVPVAFSGAISLAVDDYVEVIWASNDTDVALQAAAASSPYPAVPSATLVVDFYSSQTGVTITV